MTASDSVREWLTTADLTTQRVADCAKAHNVALVTLSRRLHREGVTYAALLDKERKRRTEELLQHRGDACAYAVMIAAGYTHENSACRAMERWFGAGIYQYNRQRK